MLTRRTTAAVVGSRNGPLTLRKNTGYVVITLALIGMFTATLVAIPVLNKNISALARHRADRPTSGSISAVEHALWRVRYDPTLFDSMSGSPPSTTYTIDLGDGPADVTIAASSDPPVDEGLTASVVVSPSVVEPNTPTAVTFTLTVTNHDNEPHRVTRVDSNPIAFTPTYVAGSTSGFTTANPVYEAGEWRWYIPGAGANIPAWGGSISMSWRIVVNEDAGNYWTATDARVLDGGTVSAPMPGAIRVVTLGDLDIQTSVTPWIVIAGSAQSYQYTVLVRNLSSSEVHLDWIKHYMPRDFDYVIGSTSGITTNDPHRNHDLINDRWEYTWNLPNIELDAGQAAMLRMRFTATLLPGWHTSTSSVLIREDHDANGQDDTANTGDAAPIISMNAFNIHVSHAEGTVDVVATMSTTGIDITSWVEEHPY